MVSSRGVVRPTSSPTTKRPRYDLLLVAGVLLGSIIGGGAWLYTRLYAPDLDERLVEEANARLRRVHKRQVHVVEPKREADLEPHLDALAPFAVLLGDGTTAVARAVAAGMRPLEELPSAWVNALQRSRADVDAVLAATHGSRAIVPTWAEPDRSDVAVWRRVAVTCDMASLRIREALRAGHGDDAVSICVDTLALGRDVAFSGVIGHLTAAACQKRLLPACVAAISVAGTRETLVRLRTVHSATPSTRDSIAHELVVGRLLLYGPMLSPIDLAKLDPSARRVVEGAQHLSFMEKVTAREGRRITELLMEDVVAAAGEDELARAEWLERVKAAAGNSSGHAVGLGDPESYWRSMRLLDAQALRFETLLALAASVVFRSERGRYPETIDELVASDLLHRTEADRRPPIQLADSNRGFAVERTLPAVGQNEPRLRLVVPPLP
jgi:hypothetical protein